MPEAEKKFIVLSHTTSDAIVLLARKHGLGVVKTWVGFAALAAAVRDVWEQQAGSSRWSKAAPSPAAPLCHPFVCEYHGHGRPASARSTSPLWSRATAFRSSAARRPTGARSGVGGHVRDKDGTLAALLIAEVAAWAKQQGTTLYQLIDQHIFLDPARRPVRQLTTSPIRSTASIPASKATARRRKSSAARWATSNSPWPATSRSPASRVTSAVIYRTGKYDAIYEPTADFQFPDEGVRFYFERPS